MCCTGSNKGYCICGGVGGLTSEVVSSGIKVMFDGRDEVTSSFFTLGQKLEVCWP